MFIIEPLLCSSTFFITVSDVDRSTDKLRLLAIDGRRSGDTDEVREDGCKLATDGRREFFRTAFSLSSRFEEVGDDVNVEVIDNFEELLGDSQIVGSLSSRATEALSLNGCDIFVEYSISLLMNVYEISESSVR
jgi:hypothetical protein